jgi:hypothetical protein
MRDDQIKNLLDQLGDPPTSEAFWTDVQASLHERAGTPVVRSLRYRAPSRGPRLAIAAALTIVVAIGVSAIVQSQSERAAPPREAAGPTATSTPDSESATSTTVAQTVPATAVGTDVLSAAAPWTQPALPQGAVPGVLIEQWEAAENRGWCPALYPDAADASVAPRRADFGGGWAIAWDLADGPGIGADGAPCTDCGRSAYGVAGTGVVADGKTGARMPSVIRFDDGSVAGYTGEGMDPANPKRLAELSILGTTCVYQVWSQLGDAHLLSLIESLRRVEGLDDGPVVPRTSADTTLIDGGPPPWLGGSVPLGEVPGPLTAPEPAPVTLVEVATLVPDATPRAVAGYAWGAAWDAPAGPGHDALNVPCEGCGRGVIGLVGFDANFEDLTIPALPWLGVVTWDDGSTAYIGWRYVDVTLPLDAATVVASDTGNRVLDGYQATLIIESFDAQIIVWSHLGFDHLLEVLNHIRLVES